MNIRCSDIEEALSAYADGQESPEETPVIRAHLESCASCRKLLAEWQRLTVPREEPLGTLPAAVAARLAEVRPRRAWVGKALVAATLLTMAATGSVLSGLTRPAGEDLAVTALDDSSAARNRAANTGQPTARPAATRSASPSARPTRSPTNRPTTARGTDGQLALVLRLDRGAATTGQSVTADFVLRNLTDHDVTFNGAAESPFDLVIRHGRDVVFRRSSTWSGETSARTVRPGEQITESFVFQAPSPGRYTVHARCGCGHNRPPTRQPSASPSPSPTNRPTDRPGTARPTDRPRGGPLSTGEIRFDVYPAE